MWIHEVDIHLVISSFAAGAAAGLGLAALVYKWAKDYEEKNSSKLQSGRHVSSLDDEGKDKI